MAFFQHLLCMRWQRLLRWVVDHDLADLDAAKLSPRLTLLRIVGRRTSLIGVVRSERALLHLARVVSGRLRSRRGVSERPLGDVGDVHECCLGGLASTLADRAQLFNLLLLGEFVGIMALIAFISIVPAVQLS